MMRNIARVAAIAVATLTAAATVADACQQIPNIPCRLDADSPIVRRDQPFEVFFTVVNFPSAAPFPPPFLDDLNFDVELFGQQMTGCVPTIPPGDPGLVTLDPGAYSVRLDEAWSPFADEPTSDTRPITATPISLGNTYGVFARACGGMLLGRCQRTCVDTVCVEAYDEPSALPIPYAQFLQPANLGDAGAVLPFDIRVLRNGYTPGVPLTVRVRPENFSDPIDLFPTEPPGLATTGIEVLGDDEIVGFQCSTHFPCFVGVENAYHVSIHDGPRLLWDSAVVHPNGIGRAIVDRTPMARLELVQILDASMDGILKTGEDGALHLRLYARNPFIDASLNDAVLTLDLPAGLSFDRAELHHHDNPMDTYDPTPAELQATGNVVDGGTVITIDTAAIVARFTTLPAPAPAVFYDLFEVELYLDVPTGGYPTPRDLVFPGLRVDATVVGSPRSETSGGVTVPVLLAAPPNPIPVLYGTKAGADVRLTWPDSVVDPSHAPAEDYQVYRSELTPTAPYAPHLLVPNSAAAWEEGFDLGAIAPIRPLLFYKVSAFNTDGNSGDVP